MYESCGLSGPWILTWAGASIMAAIFAAVWLNAGNSRLDPRCVWIDSCHTHTLASIIFTHTKDRGLRKKYLANVSQSLQVNTPRES